MDLNDVLRTHPEVFFVDSLAPLEEARLMGDRRGRFHYQEGSDYLAEAGFSTADFYYNHYNPLAPFCYFKDHLIVDFPRFTAETMIKYGVVDSIKLARVKLDAALAVADYKTFFALLDTRLALLMYIKHFQSVLPDQRSSIFWRLYARCDWRLNTFPAEFIKTVKQTRLPLKAAPGGLTVYHGSLHSLRSVHEAFSWTLDINTAIYYATRLQKKGRVFRTRIPHERVLAFMPWKKEYEIVLFPGTVKDVEEITFHSAAYYIKKMKSAGIWSLYKDYASRIKPEIFYRPAGIHGLAHTCHVLLMALLLGWLTNSDLNDLKILAETALYHDIGRSNDNFDPEHGKASYEKATNLHLFQTPDQEKSLVRFLIETHCMDDKTGMRLLDEWPDVDRERALHLFRVFKDADGLDRVRIMDLDARQLRLPESWELLLMTRQLLDFPGLV
ncbi:MAG: hypothetical protein ABRQ26_02910 [Syntrophomonadaceae bacterium]